MTCGRAKMALAICALAMLAGCGLPGAPQPPTLNLPKPPADLHATRHANKVTLTWTPPTVTTDKARIRRLGATRVCRAVVAANATQNAPPACEVIAEVPPAAGGKPAEIATYVDTLPEDLQRAHSLDTARYAVEVLNPQGRSAGRSNVADAPLAPTLPPPAPLTSTITHDGPVISWTVPFDEVDRVLAPEAAKASAPVRYDYRLSRREKGNAKAAPVTISTDEAFVRPDLRQPNVNVRDKTAQWEKHYEYSVAVITTVTRGENHTEIAGENSPPVEVTTHDVFPPTAPSGLQAVFTAAGNERYVDLTWLPSTDFDIVGYNVLRREEGGKPVRINTELVPTPTFRDSRVTPGQRYFYSVSAVDQRGNQSAPSAEASELVPAHP